MDEREKVETINSQYPASWTSKAGVKERTLYIWIDPVCKIVLLVCCSPYYLFRIILIPIARCRVHTRSYTRARTHTHAHTRAHAQAHMHTHTHIHTQEVRSIRTSVRERML